MSDDYARARDLHYNYRTDTRSAVESVVMVGGPTGAAMADLVKQVRAEAVQAERDRINAALSEHGGVSYDDNDPSSWVRLDDVFSIVNGVES